MTITPEDCARQGAALIEAANASPIPVVGRPLRLRGREWNFASEELENALGLDLDVEVVYAGALEPGITIVHLGSRHTLIRVLEDRGGRLSLHIENPEEPPGRAIYVNLWGGRTSPVLIER